MPRCRSQSFRAGIPQSNNGVEPEDATPKRLASFHSVPPQKHAKRNDIQGLRAVAIVAVLLFHLWPDHFQRGFLGVDM